MQFHIDGRFSAEVRWENDTWIVRPTVPEPAARDPVASAGLEEDDMADFLDAIFVESGER